MQKLAHISNALLLFAAVFFILFFLMFIYQKNIVDSAGNYAKNKYVEHYEKQSQKAIRLLNNGDSNLVIELLGNWDNIQKSDGAYPIKRDLFVALSEWLHANNRFEELLYWAEIWHKLDDRDVTGMAFRAEAIRNTPGRDKAGLILLGEYWRRFPKNKILEVFFKSAVSEEEFQASLSELDIYEPAAEHEKN